MGWEGNVLETKSSTFKQVKIINKLIILFLNIIFNDLVLFCAGVESRKNVSEFCLLLFLPLFSGSYFNCLMGQSGLN